MWPSLITNDKNISLVSQGLRSFFIEGGAYGTEWPKVMAASAVKMCIRDSLYMWQMNMKNI